MQLPRKISQSEKAMYYVFPNTLHSVKKHSYRENKKISVCQGFKVREGGNDGALGTLNIFSIVMIDI